VKTPQIIETTQINFSGCYRNLNSNLVSPGFFQPKTWEPEVHLKKTHRDNVFIMILGRWVYDVFHVSPFCHHFLVMCFLYERKLYLFINRGNRALGA